MMKENHGSTASCTPLLGIKTITWAWGLTGNWTVTTWFIGWHSSTEPLQLGQREVLMLILFRMWVHGLTWRATFLFSGLLALIILLASIFFSIFMQKEKINCQISAAHKETIGRWYKLHRFFFFSKQYLLFNQALKISGYFKGFEKHFLPILNLINLLVCPHCAHIMREQSLITCLCMRKWRPQK